MSETKNIYRVKHYRHHPHCPQPYDLNQRETAISNDDIFTGDDLMAMRGELMHCADSPHFSEEFRIVCRNLVSAIEEATAADAKLGAALSAYLETGTQEVLLHQQEEGSC